MLPRVFLALLFALPALIKVAHLAHRAFLVEAPLPLFAVFLSSFALLGLALLCFFAGWNGVLSGRDGRDRREADQG